MKKIDLGQALSLFANIGVIAGILLLVYELGQNRQMTEAQIRSASADQLTNILFQDVNTPEMVDVLLKAESGEPLTRREELLFTRRQSAFWRFRENVHYQYRNGLYDENEYLALRSVWVRSLNSDDAQRVDWCDANDRTQLHENSPPN